MKDHVDNLYPMAQLEVIPTPAKTIGRIETKPCCHQGVWL